ncbi:helix-turn-helix transcriptional regulator [Priestia megaterium]|uniref:helix-turn-helix transcriptional regulator n=1 Tax=Priestia megaterium TaxID=1404 RepID=UPI00272F9D86|nr:helix-turn-helix transcriptional regulator [Priestia megaterium]MDP1442087.1 helix-turn-helix transcriptional regulator [Priestia megaterium]MDP1471136.1 helix-turn-helix transcriptional regulator [Priestia megaterium]
MKEHRSYTTEETAQLLRVSKLTVYDLIKKGQLPAYRVGRQNRIDANDLEKYISNSKSTSLDLLEKGEGFSAIQLADKVIISGQDITLDILASSIEEKGFKSLRDYNGSLNSLISMYNGKCTIVSSHLFDGDTKEYNLPFIKRILTGHSYMVINLVSRSAGFFVKPGNPKNIKTWKDLSKINVTLINREKGSGARVLVDEQMRIHNLSPKEIKGYEHEEKNHLSIATAVAQGLADVGVGIEKASKMVDVDFIPLIKEQYDLVIMKSEENRHLIKSLLTILNSTDFKNKIQAIEGYDISKTGSIVFETD